MKTYFLPEEALSMLTGTEFIEKCIFDSKFEEVEYFAKALAHLSFKNLKLSRKVIKKVLKATGWSNNE